MGCTGGSKGAAMLNTFHSANAEFSCSNLSDAVDGVQPHAAHLAAAICSRGTGWGMRDA